MSSNTLLTASWLPIFLSAKSSRTVLLIDRSEPRFDGRTGGKIRMTLKSKENIDVFFNYFWLNQMQNCSGQIKKMKGWIFSFQLKQKLLLSNVKT